MITCSACCPPWSDCSRDTLDPDQWQGCRAAARSWLGDECLGVADPGESIGKGLSRHPGGIAGTRGIALEPRHQTGRLGRTGAGGSPGGCRLAGLVPGGAGDDAGSAAAAAKTAGPGWGGHITLFRAAQGLGLRHSRSGAGEFCSGIGNRQPQNPAAFPQPAGAGRGGCERPVAAVAPGIRQPAAAQPCRPADGPGYPVTQ